MACSVWDPPGLPPSRLFYLLQVGVNDIIHHSHPGKHGRIFCLCDIFTKDGGRFYASLSSTVSEKFIRGAKLFML